MGWANGMCGRPSRPDALPEPRERSYKGCGRLNGQLPRGTAAACPARAPRSQAEASAHLLHLHLPALVHELVELAAAGVGHALAGHGVFGEGRGGSL
jgi:hypothetical protein